MKNLSNSIEKYLSTDNQRIFTQRAYLVVALGFFVLSSFVSIFNNDIGRVFLVFAAGVFAVFLMNATVFVLARALFEFYFTPEKPAKTSTKKQK